MSGMTIGVLDRATLIGGVIYNNWHPQYGTVEMTAAATSPRWLSRDTLWKIYEYPFLTLKCQLVTAHTPTDNIALLDQLERLGYEGVELPRMFGRDRGCMACWLTAERWMSQRYWAAA